MAIVRTRGTVPADSNELRSGGGPFDSPRAESRGSAGAGPVTPMSMISRVDVSDVCVEVLNAPKRGPVVKASAAGSTTRTL